MTHKDLDIWRLGIELVEKGYKITAGYPKEEIDGLTNQMRRASVSIPSNISEGAARSSKKELIQFLYVALGSLAELETQTIIIRKTWLS
jgi:four helix bundle protein